MNRFLRLGVGSVCAFCAVAFVVMQFYPASPSEAAITKKGKTAPRDCSRAITTEEGDEEWFWTGGMRLDVMFEADRKGANTDAQIGLYCCTDNKDTDSCDWLMFDTDWDGAADDYLLDGTGFPLQKRIQQGLACPGYLRVRTEVAPSGTDEAYWIVCGLGTSEG